MKCFWRSIRYGLCHYYQPIQEDNLPDPKEPLYATISRQAIAEANKQVQEAVNVKALKKMSSYGRYDGKTRAWAIIITNSTWQPSSKEQS